MKKQTKKRENIVSFFNHLKEMGIPCSLTLIPQDEEFRNKSPRQPNGSYVPYTYTKIDKLRMKMVDSDKNYGILIYNHDWNCRFCTRQIDNNRPYHNRKSFLEKVEKEITDNIPEEYIQNYTRKTRLDDILSDPNPPKLI